MRGPTPLALVAAAAAVLAQPPAPARGQQTPPAPTRPAAPAPTRAAPPVPPTTGATPAAPLGQVPRVDPEAMARLAEMGRYLMTLDAFQVDAAVTREEVLADGQKVQLGTAAQLVADRPNRLRLSVNGDRHERLFLYDGKEFTLFAPRPRYFATVPAPATIRELATLLEDKYDVELPLVDLFRWGTPEAKTDEIDDARVVGVGTIEGVTCAHYAFRQDGLDWQVWIQEGAYALPRKLVITTTTDEARPQYEAVYKWNLAPSFNDDAFAFVPPPDARKIAFQEAVTQRTTGNQ